MLTIYIQTAMKHATYEILEDGTFYGEIPPCPGVFFNATTLPACLEGLQEVLEGWIALGLRFGHTLPTIDGIDPNPSLEAVEVA
jgi:predicted RNase H-like HicB family nuclease